MFEVLLTDVSSLLLILFFLTNNKKIKAFILLFLFQFTTI